ncbi:MAG: hypothetical protein ACE5FL_04565, partial [Myxococcota bacterium]
VPAGATRATQLRVDKRGYRQRLVFAFDVERAGRYSLYGTSSNDRADSLELAVNGRLVTANAFYQKTGSLRRDFERHLLARSVLLVAGSNRLTIAGRAAAWRRIVLDLRREAPLGPLRYAVLFVTMAAALALRRLIADRFSLLARARVGVAAVGYAAVLAATPPFFDWLSGGHLAPLGEQDPVKARNQRDLEAYLDSDAFAQARREKFTVFVMGDSTHYWGLEDDDRMVPVLRRALPDSARDDIEIFGLYGGALNAFDFYLLANRVAPERPDLFVIPVGVRSFSEYWLHNESYRYRGMFHYLAPVEFWRARNLSIAGREIPLVGWSLRRVDAAAFDGRVGQLLRGAKVFTEREFVRLGAVFELAAFMGWQPVPDGLLRSLTPRYRSLNPVISPEHGLFEAYRLIDALALRNGVDILYYTEQINVEALREKGMDIRLQENIAVIEDQISGRPGVHLLRMTDENPREIFSDDLDHLTPEGLAGVAAALAREIVALERAR